MEDRHFACSWIAVRVISSANEILVDAPRLLVVFRMTVQRPPAKDYCLALFGVGDAVLCDGFPLLGEFFLLPSQRPCSSHFLSSSTLNDPSTR
jgi:hypothetical protein